METIKKLIPEFVLKLIRPIYHGAVAIAANFYFGRPSDKMVIIGVTGTAGKSTTAAMLAHILNADGKKCGYITTVNFFDGEKDFINKHGLSMPGGWLLQKQLKQMLSLGCKYAVVECTSEGLAQNRHLGINFCVAIFTNLSEAHLQAHGGFENYKSAKGKLFQALTKSKSSDTKIIVNLDDPYAGYFLKFLANEKIGVTLTGVQNKNCTQIFTAKNLMNGFELKSQEFEINLHGQFNAQNALLGVVCANSFGVGLNAAAKALKDFHGVRGRMEEVPNNSGFRIIVDYGCEPASFAAALKAATLIPHNKLIHVFGSTGGHRDSAKRAIFGQLSAQFADSIIITNDDVYDSDPKEIASNIEEGIKSANGNNYEIILDRRHAIAKALSAAQKDDLVLVTGKGSEQFLVLPGNKRIEWDDVAIVRKELKKL